MALAGAGLTQFSSRGFFQRRFSAAVSFTRTFTGRLQLDDPEGLAFWTMIIGVVLLATPFFNGLVVSFGLFLLYLLASLVTLLILPRWWYRLFVTLLATPAIMAGLITIAEAFQPKVIGEGALGFLGPLMFSWAILPGAVLLRVLVRATRVTEE